MPTKSHRPVFLISQLIGVLIVVIVVLVVTNGADAREHVASSTEGVTFTVNSTADAVDAFPGDGLCATATGECTLRAAVMESNALAGADTIRLPAGTYTLTIAGTDDTAAAGDLDISGNVRIMGAGTATTKIDANGGVIQDRGFQLLSTATVTLSRLTLHGGRAADGGGLHNNGNLTIKQAIIAENEATSGYGGGIYNNGALTVAASKIENNAANGFIFIGQGGGLYNSALATVSLDSTLIIANVSDAGAGLYNDNLMALNRSTVADNIANMEGGGILNNNTLALTNSTISGNEANYGGGIHSSGEPVIIASVTLSNNSARRGGGIYTSGSSASLSHTILAGNTITVAGPECSGTLNSTGFNLLGDNSGCDFTVGPGDQVGTAESPLDPLLGPLQNNGGSNYSQLTHALFPGSPAIDAGDPAGCASAFGQPLTNDQRGYVRPVDGDAAPGVICDTGAFEFGSETAPDFRLYGPAPTVSVCAPAEAQWTINVVSLLGYANPVMLEAIREPAGTTATFTPNPVTPPGTSTLVIGNTSAAANGTYVIGVQGVAAGRVHTTTVSLGLYDETPSRPQLLTPANGATSQSLRPTFTWAAAQGDTYDIEIASDISFNTIVDSAAGLAQTSYTTDVMLDLNATYYWHVKAHNPCGSSAYSAIFTFTTWDGAFTVNSPADAVDETPGDGQCATADGICTLRAAVQETNALASAASVPINLPAGTYTLTIAGPNENAAATGDLDILVDTAFIGAGADATIINGNSPVTGDRVFQVSEAAAVTISGLTIKEGQAPIGGGIYNSGALTVTTSTIADNAATGNLYAGGGGIHNEGTLLVANSTINDNTATDQGGGIRNSGGALTVQDSAFSANSADYGGGIGIDTGAFTIENTTLSGNATTTHHGGGLWSSSGQGTVSRSTIISNTAAGEGGGIQVTAGSLTVLTSTINNNTGAGGGLLITFGADVTINDSTLAYNGSGYGGGGLNIWWGDIVTLNNVTISNNDSSGTGGGGIYHRTGILNINNSAITENWGYISGSGIYFDEGYATAVDRVTLRNTIVANNVPTDLGTDCYGTIESAGYNVLGKKTNCDFQQSIGDQVGTAGNPIDPRLGPLQDNGGPTLTHALLADSPAIDAGNPSGCTDHEGNLLLTDQRGFPRPLDGDGNGSAICDSGAYEFDPTNEPVFYLTATPLDRTLCAGSDAVYDVSVLPWVDFDDPVTLSVSGHPPGATAAFTVNPVTPPGSSVLTISDTGAAAGDYMIEIMGVVPTRTVTTTVSLHVTPAVPGSISLLSPADGATGVSHVPVLAWAADPLAESYTVEVAPDPTFSALVFTATVAATNQQVTMPLLGETTYYWRVRGQNVCGVGGDSAIFSFITRPSVTFTVNSTADAADANPGDGVCATVTGVCSLRAGVQESNALGSDNAVILNLAAGNYVLTIPGSGEDAAARGDLDISANLSILGAGSDVTTIDGNSSVTTDRVFQVHAAAFAAFSSVTIRGGQADNGGGVYSSGSLAISDSTLTANISTATFVAGGGGIYSAGPLTVVGSTVFSNTSADRGGGIYSIGSTATVNLSNSTISGNTAGYGGGLYVEAGLFSFASSTVADNTASHDGGGIYHFGGTATSKNMIWADNNAAVNGPDCQGVLTSRGYNILSNSSGCTFSAAIGDQVGVDPLLGPLQDNAGPTLTHALLAGSPAIDAGNPAGCADANGNLLTTDQRGFPRPLDGDGNGSVVCDIGAYEAEADGAPLYCSTPSLAIPDNTPAGVSDTLTITDTGLISDVNVYLLVDHTFVGDLVFDLEHVDTSTTVRLIERPGGPPPPYCGGDNIDATLDDEGTGPVEDECAAGPPTISGSLTPNNPLSVFDGQDLSGTWRLTARDVAANDIGTLQQWCVVAMTNE